MNLTPKQFPAGFLGTSGPWKVEDKESVVTESGLQIADIFGVTRQESEANARLIAAAPQLLDACGALMGALGLRRSDDLIVYDWGELGLDAVRRANVAIYKAGREEASK